MDGCLNGQGATCNLTIEQATSTNAVFELPTAAGGTSNTGGSTGGGSSGGSGSTAGGGAPAGAPSGTTGAAGSTVAGGQQADSIVEAQVIGARGGKSRIGRRIVQLELNLDENVSASLKLVRRGKTLAFIQIGKVRVGNRLLLLLVPAKAAKGRATLQFDLKDAAGNTLHATRSVKIAA